MLDGKGLQIYAFSLFLLGQKELALAEAKCLGLQVSNMDNTSRNVALGFICRLLYNIKGPTGPNVIRYYYPFTPENLLYKDLENNLKGLLGIKAC